MMEISSNGNVILSSSYNRLETTKLFSSTIILSMRIKTITIPPTETFSEFLYMANDKCYVIEATNGEVTTKPQPPTAYRAWLNVLKALKLE
jgi:hypothetical protein